MHDFDKARLQRIIADRTFTIGGEKFTRVASIQPEDLLSFAELDPDTSPADTVKVLDETVLKLITGDGAAEAWARARALKGDEALNIFDIRAVVEWLMEGLTGHPTEEPSGSSDGPTTLIGTPASTPDSYSPEELALVPST